jgi:F-type H+-transporting ATPase subunit gamma
MAGTREIKRRMKSIGNIKQVTMALEAVSTSKVRRATDQAVASRAYASLAMKVLRDIGSANQSGTPLHPLLTAGHNDRTITILLITSDRGLAGAYNTNIIRIARQFAQAGGFTPGKGKTVRWVAVGRKGRDTLIRMREQVVAEFTGLPTWLTIRDVRPIARVLMDDFLSGNAGQVYIAYTDFINMLTQRPRIQRLLPLIPGESLDLGGQEYVQSQPGPTARVPDYIYEPGAAAILDQIVPSFTEVVIYQSILESIASEHSARMVAMRNASDNAQVLLDDLQLTYNKARQSSITGEMLDIVGGVEALRTNRDR